MNKRSCLFCLSELKTRHQIKYCSSKCQCAHKQDIFIKRWESGEEDGMIGISTRTISHHLRRYLSETNAEACSLCGWNKRNPRTGKVPLEIDHIDGNFENNREENLRLLCPNCHSLTPFFRNLNRGNGRKWRTDKNKTNR